MNLYKIAIMQLTVDFNIELIQILKKLPAHQRKRIKAELNDAETGKIEIEKSEFQKFLLESSAMSDSQFKLF